MRKCQKRPIIRQKRPTITSIPEVCVSGKRDLLYDKRGPLRWAYDIGIPEVRTSVKRDLLYGKRDLFIWQKRPISIRVPEGCKSVKTDLLYGKRDLPILAYLRYVWESKETYYTAKETYIYQHTWTGRTARQQWAQSTWHMNRSLLPYNRSLLALVRTSGTRMLIGLCCHVRSFVV